ncbi:MAG: hypothetical protein ABI781_04805, partial [Burkholderiales bacterium]
NERDPRRRREQRATVMSTMAEPDTATGLYAVVGSGLQVRSGNHVLTQAALNAVDPGMEADHVMVGCLQM